ncbi:MAG: hypothetical protein WBD16_15155 [Pyrinomonadaceae bacterium]
MQLFAAILLLTCAPTALLDFAIPKWETDKATRIEDAYKYLHQATRGGEHAVPSKDAAKKWLDNEWQSLGEPIKNERTWEQLCPDGTIGRLNLRPFKDEGGKADDLLNAFLQSAREYKTEPSAFTDAWAELGKRLKKQGFDRLTQKTWKRLDDEMKKKKYPAIHHSDEYKRANRPAYRILTLDAAQWLISS